MKKVSILIAVVALAALIATPASGAPGLQLITPYPAVSVDAGKSVTFNIEVRTPSRQRVNLAVIDVPGGWTASLKGGGFVVNGVFGDSGGENHIPPQVQLDVKVPPDAPKGDYRLAVRGTSGGATDVLPLDVRVADVGEGAVTLVPEFPSLRGSAEGTFTVNLTLTNNTPESTNFELSGSGPPGWQVTARPTGQQQAATVKVDGGANSTVELTADPPENAVAGKYEIKGRAVSGQKSSETTVQVELTGNVTLDVTSPDERLSFRAVAGRTTDFVLEVRNNGTSAAENITMSSTDPSGWKVEFSPKTVKRIEAKKSAKVTAKVTPDGDSVAGDYVITMSAASGGVTDDAQIRATVASSRFWLFIGILVLAGVVYFLMRIFRQYGRR